MKNLIIVLVILLVLIMTSCASKPSRYTECEQHWQEEYESLDQCEQEYIPAGVVIPLGGRR